MDEVKREIVDLYEEDFIKIDGTGLAGDIYDTIPANLSNNASRYVLSNAREGTRGSHVRELIPDMLSSFTINIAYRANNPGVGMPLGDKYVVHIKDYKCENGIHYIPVYMVPFL